MASLGRNSGRAKNNNEAKSQHRRRNNEDSDVINTSTAAAQLFKKQGEKSGRGKKASLSRTDP